MTLLSRVERLQKTLIGSRSEPLVVYIDRTRPGHPDETTEAFVSCGKRGPVARLDRTEDESTPAFRDRVTRAAKRLQLGFPAVGVLLLEGFR